MSKESAAKYRREHLEEVRRKDRIRGKKRWKRNPQAMLETNKKSRRKLRREVVEAYGGICECCGEGHWEFLAIDHIGGGGTKQKRELGIRGSEFHRWLRKQGYPKDKYRLLCHNCNQAIGWYGYCPHQKVEEV